jgi:hypothetical protein
LEPKRHHTHHVKGPFNEAQTQKDLQRIATSDLYDLLETNLRRVILAWEGAMPEREVRDRARLCLAITREVRSRGIQMRLQL